MIAYAQCQLLVDYFTKCTDYLANEKIHQKDMAITRLFLEPFRWGHIDKYKDILCEGAQLVT